MAVLILPPTLEAIRRFAATYGVTIRTIYRWQRDGVNVADPCEVALHFAGMKNPPALAVEAAKRLLESELETLKSN